MDREPPASLEDMDLEQYKPELITIEEFAKHMGVSRTTAFDWKKHGRVKPGRDFIQIGRTIRFVWGPELLKRLLEDSLQAEEQAIIDKNPLRKPKNNNRVRSSIDFDY